MLRLDIISTTLEVGVSSFQPIISSSKFQETQAETFN